MPTLFYISGSCAMAAHIALIESKMPYEAIKVEYPGKTYNGGEDYHKRNPKGTVPFLELDNGETLTQGSAILTYIGENLMPNQHLIPKSTMDRARMNEALSIVGADIHPDSTPFFANFESVMPYYEEKIKSFYKYLDQTLGRHEYLVPSGYSVADLYLFAVTSWFTADWIPFQYKLPVDLSGYSNLKRWFQLMMDKPSVKQAIQEEGIKLDTA